MTDMRTRKTYGRQHQDQLRRIVDQAATETPASHQSMSMRDLIAQLADDIRALRERGYTIDEICALITAAKEFEHVAQSTLRRYVSAATGRRRPRRRSAKPTTPAPDTAPSADAEQTDSGGESTSASTRRGEFHVTPDREDL